MTNRSPLPHAPARLTRHRGQTRITITHPQGEAGWVDSACPGIAAFFKTLRQTAEQWTPLQRWYRVLSGALAKYLRGRELHPPPGLPAPALRDSCLSVYPSAGRKWWAAGTYCSL
jgi:hypothetical protein